MKNMYTPLDNKVQLIPVNKEDLALFQKELKESFIKGLIESLGDAKAGPIPSDEDIQKSFNAPGAVIYHLSLNDEKVGGVVLKIDNKTYRNSIELLYISSTTQGRGIGSLALQAIEAQYPETKVWELLHHILKT